MDGTLIPKSVGALMRLMADLVASSDPAARQEVDRIRGLYFGMFNAGHLSDEDYRGWLLAEFELYARFRLTKEAWQGVTAQVPLRDGAAALIREISEAGIPICVVSGASADFAEHVLETHGILHLLDAVHAGRLTHDEGGTVTGWEEETLVTVGNKGEWSRRFADFHGVPHDRIIAIGDSPGDATIGHLQEHRLLIAESENEAAVLRGLGFAGEVIVTHSFDPVADWIRRRIGLPL
jgi:HAD superfamily phosphoserine phosphatase-like hydrolase